MTSLPEKVNPSNFATQTNYGLGYAAGSGLRRLDVSAVPVPNPPDTYTHVNSTTALGQHLKEIAHAGG